MEKFQIRDDAFGLALLEAENAGEALLEFVAGQAAGALRTEIEVLDDGSAALVYDGVRYQAVPAAGGEAADARDLIVDDGLRDKSELGYVLRNRATKAAVYQSDSKSEVIAEAQRRKGWEPVDGSEQTYGAQIEEHSGETR